MIEQPTPLHVTRQPDGEVRLDLLGPEGETVLYVTMSPEEAREVGEALFKAGAGGGTIGPDQTM